jgi:hypothetical protein
MLDQRVPLPARHGRREGYQPVINPICGATLEGAANRLLRAMINAPAQLSQSTCHAGAA